MTVVVPAEHDSRRKFDGCGSHAEAGPALKVVQEGLQGLVQDLIRGLGRMDVHPRKQREQLQSQLGRPCFVFYDGLSGHLITLTSHEA